MRYVYEIMAPFSKIIEGALLLLISDYILKPYRRSSGYRHWFCYIIACFIYGGILYVLVPYQYEIWLYFLKYILLFILSLLLYRKESSIYRILFVISFGLFFNTTLSYVSQFISVLFMEKPRNLYINLTLVKLINRIQLITIIINSILQLLIIVLCTPIYKHLNKMEKHYYNLASIFLTTANLIVLLLLRMISHKSYYLSQTALILSCVFISICMIGMITGFILIPKFQTTQLENDLIHSLNQNISVGYAIIADKNDELRTLSHDFRKHLVTISQLQPEEIRRYIDDLLNIHQKMIPLCSSKDRFIDAVINSRVPLIQSLSIRFDFNIRVPKALSIAPSDTCAIIGNLLDNAIEACKSISEKDRRWISFEMDLQGDMLWIRCENSIIPGSLDQNPSLKTTKSHSSGSYHGYGIKSIKNSAQRYNGDLFWTIQKESILFSLTLVNT